MFLRFQSSVPNARSSYPGIFAMVNGLRGAGLLSTGDAEWVERQNAHANRSYADPSSVVADCYDATLNPGARSWFKDDAVDLVQMARDYTGVLDRYDIPWVELRTERPGRIVYEDQVQVVAVPFTHEDDWPFGHPRDASSHW